MDYHQNVRLTVYSREQLARLVAERSGTLKAAAAAFNVSAKTAAKWVRRYREHGRAGLADLSSRPHRCPRQTPSILLEKVFQLRRQRLNGCHIAREVKLSRATISRILRRAGMNRLRSLDPPAARDSIRTQATPAIWFTSTSSAWPASAGLATASLETAGKESRGVGWEYLHIAVDDHSRIAFSAILPDQPRRSRHALLPHGQGLFYARFGISIRRVLTDNGSCYKHWLFRKLLRRQHVKHRFTRPYTPRTNGKAERFIQTALREWAYARSYNNSLERQQQLELWLHQYNFHRPHTSLKLNPPASRSGLNPNNLLSLHI